MAMITSQSSTPSMIEKRMQSRSSGQAKIEALMNGRFTEVTETLPASASYLSWIDSGC